MTSENINRLSIDLFFGESQTTLTAPLVADDFKSFAHLIKKIRELDPDRREGSYTLELASKQLKEIDYKNPSELPFTFQANNTALIEDQRHLYWIKNNANKYDKLKIDLWKRIGVPQQLFDFDSDELFEEETQQEPPYDAEFYVKKIEEMNHEKISKLSKKQVLAWANLCSIGVAFLDEIPPIIASANEKKKVSANFKRLGFPKSSSGKL